jgi:pimeloyl-ACP methyl ester carboxylesterase
MKINSKKLKLLALLFLSFAILVCITSSSPYSGFASPQNNTLMEPQGIQNMSTNATNATNIVLVHGGWADGTGWSKQISVLRDAGHKVIAVQLPTHSLADER